MGKTRRKHKSKPYTKQGSKERTQQLIRDINQLLDGGEAKFPELRNLISVQGSANKQLRAITWPVLLGVRDAFEPEEYEELKTGQHRDSSVVKCDVERSLWFYTEGWSEEARERERRSLHAVLTAVVCKFPGDVFYYQGLHDIASVLLLNVGEKQAFRLLTCMARCQLRDCTRPSLDPVLEVLQLLMPLLHKADPELHAHVEGSGVPPFFALSWFITWFAHNVPDLDLISRIFDLLLSSHPLMPLYVAVIAMKNQREAILRCEADPSEMHRLLTNLPILDSGKPGAVLRADSLPPGCQLAIDARRLYKNCLPDDLLSLSGLRLLNSVVPEAKLEGTHYAVPQDKIVSRGFVPRNMLKQLISGELLSKTGGLIPPRMGFRAMSLTTASMAGCFALWFFMQYNVR